MEVVLDDGGDQGGEVVAGVADGFDDDAAGVLADIHSLINGEIGGGEDAAGMRTEALLPHFLTRTFMGGAGVWGIGWIGVGLGCVNNVDTWGGSWGIAALGKRWGNTSQRNCLNDLVLVARPVWCLMALQHGKFTAEAVRSKELFFRLLR